MIISTPYFPSYKSLHVPCKSPLIIMAFCLFMIALLDPVRTVHMCMCMGPSIGK